MGLRLSCSQSWYLRDCSKIQHIKYRFKEFVRHPSTLQWNVQHLLILCCRNLPAFASISMPHVPASEMGSCSGAGAAASEPENDHEVTMPEAFPLSFFYVFWYAKKIESFGTPDLCCFNSTQRFSVHTHLEKDTFPSLTWQSCQKLSCPLSTVKQLRKTSAAQKWCKWFFLLPFLEKLLTTSFLAASWSFYLEQ